MEPVSGGAKLTSARIEIDVYCTGWDGSVSLSRKLSAECNGKGVEYAHLYAIWFDFR
jgi:hypothetical protein